MSKRKKSGVNRRDFLKLAGGASAAAILFNPYKPLFDAIAKSLIADAQAAVAGQSAKNYVLFLQYGAPPRWCFDSFLNPTNQGSAFIANGSVKNFIQSPNARYTGNNADATYQNTAPISYTKEGVAKTIHLPVLWDSPLPVYRNGSAIFDGGNPLFMRDFLNNAMIIRGVDMLVDFGHRRGPELIPRPDLSAPSLSGLVADANGGAIPAIGLSGNSSPYLGFASAASSPIAIANPGRQNGPLLELLEPFVQGGRTPASDIHSANEMLMEQAMNSALDEIKAYAMSARPGSKVLFDSITGSKELLADAATAFGNLTNEFNAIRDRYTDLTVACREAVPGVIPPPGPLDYRMVDAWSRGFAVAEYMITRGYSSSFTFDVGGALGMGHFLDDAGTQRTSRMGSDEHQISDRQMSLISCHFMYRSFMACLNHFKESIGDGEWGNTVVQIGAEFGRTPRNDGTGTDHAARANTCTVFSGAIQEFMPMGNIELTPTRGNPGTWGQSAPTNIEGVPGAVRITRGMAANTVASLLGVAAPERNSISLIRPGSGTNWTGKTEDPRNV